MTPYLLSLDIGTSSIGYVVFKIDENNTPLRIIDLGVRIFSDGRDPKTKEPLAVARRTARGIRRNRDRGQNRVRRLVKELIEFELLPKDELERKKVFDQICPYEARNQSVLTSVPKEILGRALFHLGRRRGFKSNRLAGEGEESEFKLKIEGLRSKLSESITLGQYLYQKQKANHKHLENKEPIKQQSIRFKGGETEFYADRAMYKDEFNKIRDQQGNQWLTDEQWNAIEETVFFQYPLKPVPKGKCRFYPEEYRAHIDLPISHQFRIHQEVNSLRYVSQGVEYELDKRQKQALYLKLETSKTLTFKSICKLKDEHKSPYFPSDATFNLDVGSRNGKLLGNKTLCDLRKPEYLGKLADQLDVRKLNEITSYLIEPLINDLDGKTSVATDSQITQCLVENLPQLSDEQRTNLMTYRFKRGTASVSQKFMHQIVPVLRDTGEVYSDAVSLLEDAKGVSFHHSYFETGEVFEELPYYGKVMPESVWGAFAEADKNKKPENRDDDAYQYGKIANPTVHIALNQLRVVVNKVIEQQGCTPSRIHIELTRDLKNSKEARAKIEKSQTKNKKNNDRIKKLLSEIGIDNPSRDDLVKYKLWEELGKQGARFCVFSGRAISCTQLFNGEVEVEHIIPFSRCYDDGFSNKTLAFKNENHKKLNRTPHEAFGDNHDSYQIILKRALTSFGQGSKYNRFKPNAYEEFYGGEKGNMIARQLNDTKYISRKARQYLSCLCASHNVVSVNGQMTALLRDVWRLNDYKDKEEGSYREDHRHHIVDAFVVGLTSRSLINRLNSQAGVSDSDYKKLFYFLRDHAPKIDKLKVDLRNMLGKVVASYKPDHSETGSLFNDTAYGDIRGGDGTSEVVGVTRKSLEDLSFSEIFQIRDTSLRDQILVFLSKGDTFEINFTKPKLMINQLKSHFSSEKEFLAKKQEFSVNTGIKRVRIEVKNNSVKKVLSAPFKGYAKNSYAYCDVWMIPGKKNKEGEREFKFEGDFVAYSDVKEYKDNPSKGKPHPAAKKLIRLYKGDNIECLNKANKEKSVLRVAGYSTGQNKLDLRENLQAVSLGQNYISINALFKDNLVHKLR